MICKKCKLDKPFLKEGYCSDCLSAMIEPKEEKLRVVIDRSAEIDALQAQIEDQQQINLNKEIEVEDLTAKLAIIAEKEFDAHKEALRKKGYDTSGITTPEQLRDAELNATLTEKSRAPRGNSETVTWEQNANPPNRNDSDERVNQAVQKALFENGFPIEDLQVNNPQEAKDILRKVANDTSNPQYEKAREMLLEWHKKDTAKSFTMEYQGKLSEEGRPANVRKRGEWKKIKNEEGTKDD